MIGSNYNNVTNFKCCYQCCMRQPGCHAKCESYKTAKQGYDMQQKKIQDWKEKNNPRRRYSNK